MAQSDHMIIWDIDFTDESLVRELYQFFRDQGNEIKGKNDDAANGVINLQFRSPDAAKRCWDALKARTFGQRSVRLKCELEKSQAERDKERQLHEIERALEDLTESEKSLIIYSFRYFVKNNPDDAVTLLKSFPVVAIGLRKLLKGDDGQ